MTTIHQDQISNDGGDRCGNDGRRRRRRGDDHFAAAASSSSVFHRILQLSSSRTTIVSFPWLLFANVLLLQSSSSSSPPSSRASSAAPFVGFLFANAAAYPPLHNYCGKDWGDANTRCGAPCPDGEDTSCPWGESCYGDCAACPGLVSPLVPQQEPRQEDFQSERASPQYDSCDPALSDTVNFGYYQSWSKYRSADCHPQDADEIPVSEFGYTHLAYSFAGISAGGELQPYGGAPEEVEGYRKFNSLKRSNPSLKTLVAVGGWNFDQSRFTDVSSSPAKRAKFARSVVSFLDEHGFDGVDFDWEYPVTRQGDTRDYENYPKLIEAVREAYADAGRADGEWLITMAIPVSPDKLRRGYDLPTMAVHLDWFNLMSYDVHGSWDAVAGSNTDLSYISDAVDYILESGDYAPGNPRGNVGSGGVDPSQLTLGLASYGRSMTLSDPSRCAAAGCPIDGPGSTGCSGEAGFHPYFELMERYVDPTNYDRLSFNAVTGSMEMILDGNVFVSFDGPDTFRIKREFYRSRCLRGKMWWATDMIKEKIDFDDNYKVAPPTPSLPPPPATTPAAPRVSAPGVINSDAYCDGQSGLVSNDDCTGFVHCDRFGKMLGSITMCSAGLVFDANMGICNWPAETNLCGFRFCDEGYTGYVPFEVCTKFYYCKGGKIDGDIDFCPPGTMFDFTLGVCNWASTVTCETKGPTLRPTPRTTPRPTYVVVSPTPPAGAPVGSPTRPSVEPPIPSYAYAVTPTKTVTGGDSPPNPAMAPVFSWPDEDAPAPTPRLTPPPTRRSSSSSSNVLRFGPSDDAYVQEKMPYENYNDKYIVVDKNLRFDGLLRFYVQGVEGRKIESVKLRLFVSNPSIFGGNFFACNPDWHEDVVTWDTVPSIMRPEPLAVVNHAVLRNEWIEVDLSVDAFVVGNGPVALRVTSDDIDNVMYSSKENPSGNAPVLLVTLKPEKPTLSSSSSSSGSSNLVVNPGTDLHGTAFVTAIIKVGPTDDSFVVMSTPRKNYGTESDLVIDADSGVKNALLRFDLNALNDIKSVESAILRLYATDGSPSGGTFVKTTDAQWDESSVTWDDAPAADDIVIGTMGPIVKDSWYELDVTRAVKEVGPLSIRVSSSHNDRAKYSSKNGAHSPQLVLTLREYAAPSDENEGEEEKTAELLPTDDATVVLQHPFTNYGSKGELEIDADDGFRNFLLRFDASEIPRGGVKSATLRLYAKNKELAFGGTFVETSDSNWNELTVTWDNAPRSDGKVLGAIRTIEGGTWYDLDVTAAVLGGDPVTFRASSPHATSGAYGSRSSDRPPTLIVRYDDDPRPSPPEGFEVLRPTDDASVLMESRLRNFGTMDDALKVDGDSGVYNSLIRFDLTSIERDTVNRAVLRLYAVDGSPSGGTFVSTTVTEWDHYSVTWNSAPAADGNVLATLGAVVPYRWYEVDVTNYARGGKPISIRITPSHGNRCAYASSREAYGRGPELWIKHDPFLDMSTRKLVSGNG